MLSLWLIIVILSSGFISVTDVENEKKVTFVAVMALLTLLFVFLAIISKR